MQAVRRSILVFGMVLVVGTLAACEPRPPRLQLVVTSSVDGGDSNPGDGLCHSPAASGACTLRAALQEANAAVNGAEVLVPAGSYQISDNQRVTGDVIIRRSGSAPVELNAFLTVEAGAFLRLNGINTHSAPYSSAELPYLTVEVRGSAVINGSWVSLMRVASGGTTVLLSAIVGGHTPIWAIENSGTLVAVGSSILGGIGESSTALVTTPRGITQLSSTVVAGPQLYVFGDPFGPEAQSGCSGGSPTSLGYVHVEVPCGGDPGAGDSSGPAGTYISREVGGTAWSPYLYGFEHSITASSPLIDAVPVGEPGCEIGAVDFYGNPRGVDGNGDGIGGCDIGAVEFQP